ncbi:phage holin family protein [Blastococcus sp. URHD0036]|uniref:phage holin family protein n=1 Tax=Blastococcus sp. URHD0036 TaxID=1380356 RepID=UPI000495DCC8|nr:phage holin family protein [Blastococcus sp. URHD0036]
MIRFALKVVALAAAFYFVAENVPGIDVVGNEDATLGITGTFLWVGLIFAVVNAVAKPILTLLSLPFLLLTLGLFYFVLNAAMLGLTALLTTRLTVEDFWAALVGGFILALVSWVFDLVFDRD